MALDAKRGIVYVPTGSATPDFYGADRHGDNLFANSLSLLNAETGKRIWHFQGVQHDIWDRDFPAPPTLVTVKRDGKAIDAVVADQQARVRLRARPHQRHSRCFRSSIASFRRVRRAGRTAAPARSLFRSLPAPFARQLLTEDQLTNRTPAAREWALGQFRQFVSAGQFVPFSVGRETVMLPGFDGGAEWGGSAFDPKRASVCERERHGLDRRAASRPSAMRTAAVACTNRQCASVIGTDLAGSPPLIPSLVGVAGRVGRTGFFTRSLRKGSGPDAGIPDHAARCSCWPSFEYVLSGETHTELSSGAVCHRTAEISLRQATRSSLDPDGYPAVAPPWGTLNAIDLNTGKICVAGAARRVSGASGQGLKNTGSENYGGPLVTAGGLVFIGATNFDKKFRAFDKATGELLWEAQLPFPGNATPATYQLKGANTSSSPPAEAKT